MNLESEFFLSSKNRLSTYAVRGIRRPSSSILSLTFAVFHRKSTSVHFNESSSFFRQPVIKLHIKKIAIFLLVNLFTSSNHGFRCCFIKQSFLALGEGTLSLTFLELYDFRGTKFS